MQARLPSAVFPHFSSEDAFEQIQDHIAQTFLRPRAIGVPPRVVSEPQQRPEILPAMVRVAAADRANLASVIFGDAVARDFLLLGLLTERGKAEIAALLARSLYYDQPTWRPFLKGWIERMRRTPFGKRSDLVAMLWLVSLDADGARAEDRPALEDQLQRSERDERRRPPSRDAPGGECDGRVGGCGHSRCGGGPRASTAAEAVPGQPE